MTQVETDNAPHIFFEQAATRRTETRFMVPAADGQWRPVTWGEAEARTRRLASFLMDRGVDHGSKVAVLSGTRLEWGIAGLAALAARGTLVPVYPSLMPDQLAHILDHSGAEVLVVENAEQLARVLSVWDQINVQTLVTVEPQDLAGLVADAGRDVDAFASLTFPLEQAEVLGAASLESAADRVDQRLSGIDPQDVGYLIYTSGTTGLPKGVLLTHQNVGVSGSDWIELNASRLHEGDVDLLWLPMSHVFGWGEFCLGNQLGFVTHLSDPVHAMGHLLEARPHVFMSVPAYWEKLAQLARAGGATEQQQQAELRRLCGGRLRFCLSGGAGLRREVKELFLAAGMLIIEGYGLTECSPTLTMNRADDFDFDSVGKPFPSVRLELAEDGEILAKGPNVFAGYHKDPEATAAIFNEDGWLCTGDLGRFNERGFLQIIGRKKEILVTAGGKNIPPENIELRFKDDALVAQLVVYGDGKKYLTAVVDIDEQVARQRLEEKGAAPGTSLRQHPRVRAWVQQRVDAVNEGLARHETIKKFCIAPTPITVEAGLLTPSLKVKRAKVHERFGAALEALYEG